MKHITFKILSVVIIFTALSFFNLFSQNSLILIDTGNHEPRIYQSYIDILKSLSWKTLYKPIDIIMDEPVTLKRTDKYDAMFFIFSLEFLKGINTPVAQKIVRLINFFSQHKNKLVGFIFPPLAANPHINILSGLGTLFNPIGLDVHMLEQEYAKKITDQTIVNQKVPVLFILNAFLTTPVETRPLGYHTSLSHPKDGTGFFTPLVKQALAQAPQELMLLPQNPNNSDSITPALPYGVYWYNKEKDLTFFLGTTTLLTFSGITENCHFCPIDCAIRNKIHENILQMMHEVTTLYTRKNTGVPALPISVQEQGKLLVTEQNDQLRKNAWMEIVCFNDSTKEAQQDTLVKYILTSGLDALWISLTPNVYYSDIARFAQETKRQEFITGVSRFTKKLKELAQKDNLKIPAILVGFEVANNLYAPNLPSPCAVDLYGNMYEDVPSPVDSHFWDSEIKKPLETFVNLWKDPQVNNGLTLSGVVIDLELYCRKTSAVFLDTMGFENPTFERFIKYKNLSCKPMPTLDMISYFMNKKLTHSYFSFLEQESEAIARSLKEFFNKKIPNCTITCYTPTVLVNWFYKGFYKGLSSAQAPVYLFTFNTEFQTHKNWFKEKNINIRHASVLLLSKLGGKKDFPLVENILSHHNGIWFNRFSRFVEPKSNNWISAEQPVMPEREYQEFFNYLQSQK